MRGIGYLFLNRGSIFLLYGRSFLCWQESRLYTLLPVNGSHSKSLYCRTHVICENFMILWFFSINKPSFPFHKMDGLLRSSKVCICRKQRVGSYWEAFLYTLLLLHYSGLAVEPHLTSIIKRVSTIMWDLFLSEKCRSILFTTVKWSVTTQNMEWYDHEKRLFVIYANYSDILRVLAVHISRRALWPFHTNMLLRFVVIFRSLRVLFVWNKWRLPYHTKIGVFIFFKNDEII